MTETDETTPRKLRIALMGEFSAGKSTLANLLLEQESSPVQVTATQLPPVWYSSGSAKAERVTTSGERETLDIETWRQSGLDNTRMISVSLEASFLDSCDLIDMPGTSDPNMAPDFWEKILPEVDCVIWCTPANQAWRQSEAALWEQVPPKLWKNSLLLITRADKLRTDRDRARMLMRVRREANGIFRDVLPISLTQALAGREDAAVFEQSGAAALLERIGDIFESLDKHALPAFRTMRPSPAPKPEPIVEVEPETPKIMPRRVVLQSSGRGRPRPTARPQEPAEPRMH